MQRHHGHVEFLPEVALKLIDASVRLTYKEAIADLIDCLAVRRVLATVSSSGYTPSPATWVQAFETDIVKVNDLAQAFCEDIRSITGVKIVLGTKFTAICPSMPKFFDQAFVTKFAREASSFLMSLPRRIACHMLDDLGTPTCVPVSSLLEFGGGYHFVFPNTDMLSVRQEIYGDMRMFQWHFQPSIDADGLNFEWGVFRMEEIKGGEPTGRSATVISDSVDTTHGAIVIDACWPGKPKRRTLRDRAVALYRTASFRCLSAIALIILCVVATLLLQSTLVAPVTGTIVAVLALLFLLTVFGAGYFPTPFVPQLLVPARVRHI